MPDIVDRLMFNCSMRPPPKSEAGKIWEDGVRQGWAWAQAEIERLRAEVEEWRECAQYDPLMEGPRFKGWDRSALDRCRRKFIEARKTDDV